MLQVQGNQYTSKELKYIYSALMMAKVTGEEARTLVALQDKTLKNIEMLEAPISEKNSTHPAARK
jgi:hypothetical protein